MEKVDFLNYRALVLEVRRLRSFLDALDKSLGAPSGPEYSLTPKAPQSAVSQVEARVIKLSEMEGLYEEHLAKAQEQIYAIERAIQSLESPAERLVMRSRYIEGRSWSSILSRLQCLGYSERQMYRLHGSALMNLKEV